MNRPTRTRYAPSPTGRQHVGGIRTALFAWLWARHNEGTFILRIEDTDQQRFKEEALQDLFDSLAWLDLQPDEGPEGPTAPPNDYFQSQRGPRYREIARQMVERGVAYECYCSKERLEALRAAQEAARQPTGYDRHCRFLSPEERAAEAAACAAEGRTPVVRFAVPLEGSTTVPDVIRGSWTTANQELEDLVLLKSDGLPTYHLGHIVDDHDMGVTEVMRGVEYVPTAPLHVLIHEAMGWPIPTYVHLPLVLNPTGEGKMSKRKQGGPAGDLSRIESLRAKKFIPDALYAYHQRTGKGDLLTMVQEFRDAGFLPEALLNYLVLLGWSVGGDRDIATRDELIALFDIANIKKSPSAFDYNKLEYLNGWYIRQLPLAELADRIAPELEAAGLPTERERLLELLPLVQERMKLLSEAPELLDFFLGEAIVPTAEALIPKKMDAAATAAALQGAHEALSAAEWTHEGLEQALRARAEAAGLKAGQLFQPIRVAVTGRRESPGLFETLYHVGRERTLARIERAQALLAAPPSE